MVELAAAVLVRNATPSDAEAIARVHIASSEDAYAPLSGNWSRPDLQERTSMWERFLGASATDATRFELVAMIDDHIVGFIGAGPNRRKDIDAEVEVYVIHVLPEHRGRGVGTALWNAAHPRLRGNDLRSMIVQTLAELRCCSFYEQHGGCVAERKNGDMDGAPVTEVVYLWPRFSVR